MIYAHFNYKNGQVMNYSLSGHAESGPYGHDLVCAAVSALTIGTANNLSRLAEIEPEMDANQEEGGFIEIVLPSQMDKHQQETAQILLKSLYYSLLDIQEEYQEYISVSKTNNE